MVMNVTLIRSFLTMNIVLCQGHMFGYAIPPDAVLDDKVIHIQKLESHQLPEHLQGLLERSVKRLSKDKANQVKDLLIQYQDIFSKGGHDLGCFTEIKHVIDTGEERRSSSQCDGLR